MCSYMNNDDYKISFDWSKQGDKPNKPCLIEGKLQIKNRKQEQKTNVRAVGGHHS